MSPDVFESEWEEFFPKDLTEGALNKEFSESSIWNSNKI